MVEDVPEHLYAFHQHVIYIHLHVLPDQFSKHLVHQALVSGSGIPQLKRHYLITIQSLIGNEGNLLLIYLVHLYLTVPEKCSHEAEELVP
jgi:hypothetical protein